MAFNRTTPTNLIKKAIWFFLLIAAYFHTEAQMSGTYSIPGNFSNLATAISSLNTVGVNGPVTINISAAYTETVPIGGFTLFPVPGASASNSLVIQRSGIGSNPLLVAYSGGTATAGNNNLPDAIWSFVGTDYVTINGIDLYDPNTTNPSTMEYGYVFYRQHGGNGCQYNTVQNCTVTLNRVNNAGVANTGIGPVFAGSKAISFVNISYNTPANLTTATAVAGSHSYNKIYGNLIQNCHMGILLGGWALSNPAYFDGNNDIGGLSAVTGNTIINFGGVAPGTFASGIYTYANHHLNESFNYINNNNGSGFNHPYTLRGITNWFTAQDANVTIFSNTVTLKASGTSQRVTGIENVDGSTGITTNTFNVSNNLVTDCSYTTPTSGDFIGYWFSGPTNRIILDQNREINIVCAQPIAAMYFNSANLITVTSNTVSNLTSGSYLMGVNCPDSPTLAITNNIFENMKASTWLEGLMPGAAVANFSVTGNTLRNFAVAGNAYLYGIHEIGTNTNKVIKNNTIHSFSISTPGTGGANVAGIYCTKGTISVSSNTIHSLSSAGTNGTNTINVYGILVNGGQFADIQKNKIYALSCTSQKGYVCGISNSITAVISNNIIGNFLCTSCVSATNIAGIELKNGNNSLYHNSVYLNASSTTSLSGTTALFASTLTTLDMRNNLLVNVSTPTGAAVTSAFRMDGSSLSNYAATSNNNLFYGGIPSSTNVIYAYNNVAYSSLLSYKYLVYPRDLFSVTELPPFTSTVPSSNNYLSINTNTPTQVESGGTFVSSVPDDIVNTLRNPASPDIGAWEDNYIPLDLTPPMVLGSGFTSTNTCPTVARTYTVNLLDVTGVAGGTLSPRVYYKINNNAYSSVAGTLTAGTFTNGIWNFVMSYTCNPGDIISYFLVAQDTWTPYNLFAVPSTSFTGFDVNNIITPPISPNTYSISASPTITINSGSICPGGSFTLVPSGAISYTFSSGSPVVSPTITTTYSVTGTNTLGCISVNAGISNITVHPLPTITVNSGSICLGNSFTINPNGANTYTFSGGSSVVAPTINTSYSVTGTNSLGCVSATPAISSITVNVIPLPVITVNSGSICSGNSFTMLPTGANTYTFSGGSSIENPTFTSSYSVTGTSTAGCVSAAAAISTVTVIALPIITVNSGAICTGQSFTMVPGGASSYTISGGNAIVNPGVSTTYSINGTNTFGCNNLLPAISNVTVLSLPSITVTSNSTTICIGETATLTATGANSYTWSSGGTTVNEIVTPTITTNYSVTGIGSNSCLNTGSVTQNVDACLGIELHNLNRSYNIHIYPNPNSGKFIIDLDNTFEKISIEIYNSTGQIICKKELIEFNNSINISEFAEGIYHINIYQNNSLIKNSKIIKE